MAKKIKSMAYLPLNLTQNTDVALGGYYINFLGSNGYDYFDIGDNYLESEYDNLSSRGTDFYQDANGYQVEAYNYNGQLTKLSVTDLDINLLAFDTNVSANPTSRIAALANGDITFDSQRIQVNGQLGLNGEYRVGDKTFTITNGIITAIV